MAVIEDPVSPGYVTSLARPGGNITGVSNDLGPINGKRLQILKEAVPTVSRVAIFDPTGRRVDWKMMESVSRALGIQLHALPFKRSGELESSFNAIRTNAGERANDSFERLDEFAPEQNN